MYMEKYMPDHFGRHGFKRPPSAVKKVKAINVSQLEEMFPGKKEIDLGKEGYGKLIGSGTINTKFKIKVDKASSKAITKVEEKGGEVIIPEAPKEVIEDVAEEETVEEK
jgi:large subunit ribosomal protein L15